MYNFWMFNLVVRLGHQAPVCQQLIHQFRSALSVSSSLTSRITDPPIIFKFWPPHCRPRTRCPLDRRRGELRGRCDRCGKQNVGCFCREPNWGLSGRLAEVNLLKTLQYVWIYWTWLEIRSYFYHFLSRYQLIIFCYPTAILPSVISNRCHLLHSKA